MLIETTRFGQIEIDENLIFDFIKPILGYDNLTKFILIEHSTTSPFKWLQAIDDPAIAFPVTNPALFDIEYEFVLPQEDAELLNLNSVENLLSLNIARIPSGNPTLATVNLLGPIIVNTETKKAIQLVLSDTNYSVREPLFKEKKVDSASSEQEKES